MSDFLYIQFLSCHCTGVFLMVKKNAYLRLCAQYVTAISFLLAVSPNSEGVIECEAPSAVCEWRERIVGIKMPNMIASGILMTDGEILTNRHVVEDHRFILLNNFDGSVEKASILRSSGISLIDNAALKAALESVFYPIEYNVTFKIEYELKLR